ncbi:MAG TPA: patatin-like phospholipase family protein, partial [Geobacterales bacterium]|nr:patatin-like phospholipase family protein [Geobacterales bacterium]
METKVCIALGGGAARGLAHLGVLKVLHEEGIPIHLVTGTSLGALVGALYATRPDPCHWMTKVEAYLRSVHWRRSQMEFLRRAEEGNGGQGIFADMANLVRKSYFWGMTATHSAFVSEAEYREFINPLI